MSHSPGPWRLVRRPDGVLIVEDVTGADLMGNTDYYPWVPVDEDDWRLIAAAPRLLSVLQALLVPHWGSLSLREKSRRLDEARAAVSEATERPTPE